MRVYPNPSFNSCEIEASNATRLRLADIWALLLTFLPNLKFKNDIEHIAIEILEWTTRDVLKKFSGFLQHSSSIETW